MISTSAGEYSTYFSGLFKDMGIAGFTFHNHRHTFASLMQSDLGIGAITVMGMTGHSSLGMLQKYSLIIIEALEPPNPKELESTVFTSLSNGSVTIFNAHPGSGVL